MQNIDIANMIYTQSVNASIHPLDTQKMLHWQGGRSTYGMWLLVRRNSGMRQWIADSEAVHAGVRRGSETAFQDPTENSNNDTGFSGLQFYGAFADGCCNACVVLWSGSEVHYGQWLRTEMAVGHHRIM